VPHHDDLLRLVGKIYDAAGDPTKWHVFLDDLSSVLNGHATMLSMEDFHAGATLASAVKVDPVYQREYEEHYSRINVWMRRDGVQWEAGRVYSSQSICSDAEVERSEYYNDYLRRLDLFHACGATIRKDSHTVSAIFSLRPRRMGAWGRELDDLFQPLLPHLQRAVELHRRLHVAESASHVSADLLDRLPIGVILLARDGSATFCNRAARAIVDRRDGLAVDKDGLRAASSASTTALRRQIGEAVACATGESSTGGGALRLARPSGKRDLRVLVSPVPSRNQWGHEATAAALVLVSDPDDVLEPNAEIIARLFGFTPTESVVAVRLAAGDRVEDIAEQLGLSMNTVRWHVKHLLDKPGVRSQAQFVRLLRGSPAAMTRQPATDA